eukprot:TRINITY_DN1042_c0_g3_i2.p1 TRINITY_DN1042_c0_g3~~TRINITY_DN1042_c0_g3_i2.p1  ORF type:complete len:214 (+),score=49.16 TRINITY_DN1042_c0_g3_i2:233-874(+)
MEIPTPQFVKLRKQSKSNNADGSNGNSKSVPPPKSGRASFKNKGASFASSCSLEDMFAFMTREEELCGDCQYACPKCNSPQDAIKRAKLDGSALPKTLVIAVNRVRWSMKGQTKINSSISFVLDDLDLSPYVHEQDELKDKSTYELSAAVIHYGNKVGDGHYTVYCYNPEKKAWFLFNDSKVIPVKPKEVLADQPYILFYNKKAADRIAPADN